MGSGKNKESGRESQAVASFSIDRQYVKDLSCENPHPANSDLENLRSSLSAKVSSQNIENSKHQVSITLGVTTKDVVKEKKVFLLELEYVGLFEVKNIAQEYLEPFLHIECARLLFPFIRSIVAQMTIESSLPPIYLAPIDFAALYQQSHKERS